MKRLKVYITASVCLMVMTVMLSCREKQVEAKVVAACGKAGLGCCSSSVPARFSAGSKKTTVQAVAKPLPAEKSSGKK
jgi:hypothetical protein